MASVALLDAALLRDEFDCERFISSLLKEATFEVLHHDLETYVERVNNELLSIINDDYSSFLELSRMLVHIDSAVADLRRPLVELEAHIGNVQDLIAQPVAKQRDLKASLEVVRYKRRLLELELFVWETTQALGPISASALKNSSSRSDISNTTNSTAKNNTTSLSNNVDAILRDAVVEVAAKAHANGGKDIDIDDEHPDINSDVLGDMERKAQAFARLPFIVAMDDELPLMREAQTTIGVLEEGLVDQLKAEFGVEITPDGFMFTKATISSGEEGGSQVATRAKRIVNKGSLVSCLRAYALLGRVEEAESVFREMALGNFLDSCCTVGKLDGGTRNSCSGLSTIYRDILEFLVHECQTLLTLVLDADQGLGAFDFIGNGVAVATAQVLTKKLPHIFSSGSGDTLHASYTSTRRFFSALESISTRPKTVQEVAHAFLGNWNLPVYYELRFQEHTNELEKALAVHVPHSVTEPESGGVFYLDATRLLQQLMRRCLNQEKVMLKSLGARFFRLSLQLAARYVAWGRNGAALFARSYALDEQMISSTFAFAVGSSLVVDDEQAASAWTDCTPPAILMLHHDATLLRERLRESVAGTVATMCEMDGMSGETAQEQVSVCMEAMAMACDELSMQCHVIVTAVIAQLCILELSPVAQIPESFYFRNKPIPTTPSAFMERPLQPLLETLSSCSSIVPPDGNLYASLANEVVRHVGAQYAQMCAKAWAGVERKVEALQKVNKDAQSRVLQEKANIKEQFRLDTAQLQTLLRGIRCELPKHEIFEQFGVEV